VRIVAGGTASSFTKHFTSFTFEGHTYPKFGKTDRPLENALERQLSHFNVNCEYVSGRTILGFTNYASY
jgi:hypothetical protein